jgi:phospholipase/carboxylesterase
LDVAEAAVVLVHGRGATAQSILQMGRQLHREGVALLAPQADRNTWYPNSFLQPVESNEPGRSSGLQAVADAVGEAEDAGIPTERVLVLGFSQGACLSSEYVARNPRRYGGLVAFSGGLIGETIDPDEFEGSLEGTPAFLGCRDTDPRLGNVRANPLVTVLVDHYEEDWSRLWWVRVRGDARVHEDGPERDRAIEALAAKYQVYREQPPQGPAIVVDAKDWLGWSAE